MSAEHARREAERVVEAFLSGEPLGPTDETNAHEDAALTRLEDDLRRLSAGLDALSTPSPEEPLLARTLRASTAELHAALRPGELLRELLRLVGATVAALPLFVAWNAAVLFLAPPLLAVLLPETLASALPALYVFGAVGWLALLSISLPAFAQRSLTRKHREALG